MVRGINNKGIDADTEVIDKVLGIELLCCHPTDVNVTLHGTREAGSRFLVIQRNVVSPRKIVSRSGRDVPNWHLTPTHFL